MLLVPLLSASTATMWQFKCLLDKLIKSQISQAEKTNTSQIAITAKIAVVFGWDF